MINTQNMKILVRTKLPFFIIFLYIFLIAIFHYSLIVPFFEVYFSIGRMTSVFFTLPIHFAELMASQIIISHYYLRYKQQKKNKPNSII